MASETIINSPSNDPVTKAVVDNIMGNLPTKKPLVRCDDCDLCFTSQTVLDAHLQGSRHAKQIRSKVIMATLEETKVAFTKDQEANGLKCNICNVSLNSIQQLQTHLNGNRHKKKIIKGGWTEPDVTSHGESFPSSSSSSSGSVSRTNPAKCGVILTCDACNKFFNSMAQYQVHTTSRKHIYKETQGGLRNKKRRFFPYRKRTRSEIGQNNLKIPSLSNNFVSGGYFN